MRGNTRRSSADAIERGDAERDFQFLPLRAQDEEAIAELGIGVPDFLFFRLMFVGSPWTYATKRVTDRDWSLRRGQPLSAPLLIEHLRGARWVATGAKKIARTHHFVTNWLAFDLDFGGDVADLYRRYDGVLSAFGRPGLVFRSSDSGGLHLYYFLDDLVHLHQLRKPDGDGAVRRILRTVGLDEVSGQVEVYPRGNYLMRGMGNRLRLPFGAGSMLLDQESLLPAVTPWRALEDLKFVRRQFTDGKIEPLESAALLERAWAPSEPRKPRRRSGHRAADDDIARREEYVARLQAVGLTERNEFNRAVSALAFDGFWSGATEDATTASIVEWLERGFHNGLSDTYSADSEGAIQEVRDVVTRIFKRHRPSVWGPVPALTESEVRFLLEATGGNVLSDPATGEVLNRFKVQRFAFELQRRAKQYVLTTGGQAWSRSMCDIGAESGLGTLRNLWPDPGSDEFIVACPYALRVSLPLVSEKTVGACWNAVKDAGLFRLHQASAWPKPSCERYRVRLGFSENERHFDSLDIAVRALLEPADIRRLYTRSHARRVLAATVPVIEPVRQCSEFEALLARRLADARTPRAA